MAPPFVLLESFVPFVVTRGPTGGASEKAAADILKTNSTEAALEAMKPELSVVEPPEVSRLVMVSQTWEVPPPGGLVCSTDKALVVLCAGQYHPGFTRTPSSGCYLVYDASTNSLSAVPQLPPSRFFRILGRGTAILSRGRGTYVLAEIGTTSGPPCDRKGVLYLWRCTSPDQGQSQWDCKSVCLPSQVIDLPFLIDAAFSYAGSSICWVDLLEGVLVCNLLKAAAEEEPEEFTFVPLPQGYSIDVGRKPRPRPEQFRNMSCVNGVITFVALVGFYENNFACDNVRLKIWTLSPDLKEWKLACNPLPIKDLWASVSFCNKQLPRIPPMFPVLSCNEDHVVYLSLKEIERKNVYDIYGQFEGVEVEKKARHVLRVDVMQNKVLDSHKITKGTLLTMHWPTMLATDITSYCKDHEGEREASMA